MANISKALGRAIFAKTLSDKIAEAHDEAGSSKGKALNKKTHTSDRHNFDKKFKGGEKDRMKSLRTQF